MTVMVPWYTASLALSQRARRRDGGQAAKRDPAGTYMMSRPVKSLAFFASHSWSCPRWLKFVALLAHFNLDAAVAVVAVLHAALFVLELLFHDR